MLVLDENLTPANSWPWDKAQKLGFCGFFCNDQLLVLVCQEICVRLS